MSKQPEALRLADVFEKEGYAVFTNDMQKASTELRRLHAEVERLRNLVPDVELAHEAIYAKAEGR